MTRRCASSARDEEMPPSPTLTRPHTPPHTLTPSHTLTHPHGPGQRILHVRVV